MQSPSPDGSHVHACRNSPRRMLSWHCSERSSSRLRRVLLKGRLVRGRPCKQHRLAQKLLLPQASCPAPLRATMILFRHQHPKHVHLEKERARQVDCRSMSCGLVTVHLTRSHSQLSACDFCLPVSCTSTSHKVPPKINACHLSHCNVLTNIVQQPCWCVQRRQRPKGALS